MMRVLTVIGLLLTACAIGVSQEKQQATLLGNWSDNTILSSSNHNNAYNEIWGLAVNGHEYAVIGTTEGTHFFDLSDPSNLEETFFVEGASVGVHIIHRDYHDHNGYLYAVADEGEESTLQIIDISQLPESIEVVYDSGEFSVRTHNIFIDTVASRMYMCKNSGTNLDRIAMRILDISNPVEPELIYSMTEIEGIGQVSTVHDAYVDDNIAYLNIGTQGFVIMDFNDIDNPSILGYLSPNDYMQSGYNHSGYVTEDKQYYYMADETHSMDIKALDLKLLPDIFVTDTIDAGTDHQFSIPHNLIAHDGFLYVSYYYDGLQIYDLTDPEKPQNVMYYPTSSVPYKNRYEGAWGVYPLLPSGRILVSDMQEGLFVIEQTPALTSVENEDTLLKLTVSPNPSFGDITIETNKQESANIQIFDLQGRSLYSTVQQQSKITLDLQLESGTYFVQYKTQKDCITTPLVIQH